MCKEKNQSTRRFLSKEKGRKKENLRNSSSGFGVETEKSENQRKDEEKERKKE